MPTSLARLFGRGRHRKGGDHGYSLRLAAALMEADEPWRVLAVACRLARRLQGCQIAVIGAWNDQEQPPVLDLVTGHRHRRDQRLFQEALAGRHSPLPALTDRPRWIKLSDDPFQPGASLLRRIDLEWALALPFVADLDGQARRCVMLLAGGGKSIDQHHPLVRDARLIWLAALIPACVAAAPSWRLRTLRACRLISSPRIARNDCPMPAEPCPRLASSPPRE